MRRSASSLYAEIINVGNELLDGRTVNTNLTWIGERMGELGFIVKRAMIVRDDLKEISSAVKDALRRKPRWIIISGGLGPTHDDMTLEGVAKALGKRTEVNLEALQMIREHYEKLVEKGLASRVELTKERIKMAKLPKGAKPLKNNVGTAPGVLIKFRGVKIACLPGVPSELKDIFQSHLLPMLEQDSRGAGILRKRITVKGILESSLAPIIEETMKKFKGVYIKSSPRGFEGDESVIDVDFIFEKPVKGREKILEDAIRFLMEKTREGG